MFKVALLKKQRHDCFLKRENFRTKNIGVSHDEPYLSGYLLHSSVARFLANVSFFEQVDEHLSKRPKDKLFKQRALIQLKKTGLLTDRKTLKSRTRWINSDKAFRDTYLELLNSAIKLFEVKS